MTLRQDWRSVLLLTGALLVSCGTLGDKDNDDEDWSSDAFDHISVMSS